MQNSIRGDVLISRLQKGEGLKGNLSQKTFFSFFSKKMSNCAHVIDISVVKKGALNTFCVATQVHLATLAVVKS